MVAEKQFFNELYSMRVKYKQFLLTYLSEPEKEVKPSPKDRKIILYFGVWLPKTISPKTHRELVKLLGSSAPYPTVLARQFSDLISDFIQNLPAIKNIPEYCLEAVWRAILAFKPNYPLVIDSELAKNPLFKKNLEQTQNSDSHSLVGFFKSRNWSSKNPTSSGKSNVLVIDSFDLIHNRIIQFF